ncbi:hypothetical protein EOM09_07665 [bacterium]|nr:hypothetical protein [bacterium]
MEYKNINLLKKYLNLIIDKDERIVALVNILDKMMYKDEAGYFARYLKKEKQMTDKQIFTFNSEMIAVITGLLDYQLETKGRCLVDEFLEYLD